jgi:hypothetical protein
MTLIALAIRPGEVRAFGTVEFRATRLARRCDYPGSNERRGETMKKFVFLTYGFVPPTPEIMEAWGNWFASIGDKMVDSGGPSGGGREITRAGTTDLPLDLDAFTGYVVINAADLDEATAIAETCPIITAIRVYETRSM